MKKKNTVLRGFTLKIALATLPVGAAGAVLAGPLGIQVAAGVGDHHIKKLDLGFAWDPNWTWWPIGDWHFALIGEAHLAWWHTNEGNVHDDIGEIGVTPVIRFIKSSGPGAAIRRGGRWCPASDELPYFHRPHAQHCRPVRRDGGRRAAVRRSSAVSCGLPLSACLQWRYQRAQSWYKFQPAIFAI
jgi:hypothetical protein